MVKLSNQRSVIDADRSRSFLVARIAVDGPLIVGKFV